jgi:hypothetical protein
MVDQFLDDESGNVEADDIGLLNQVAKGRDLVIHVEFIGVGEGFQALGDLLFERILVGGFHQLFFHEFHGDGIGKPDRVLPYHVDGGPPCMLFGGFDSGWNA